MDVDENIFSFSFQGDIQVPAVSFQGCNQQSQFIDVTM